MSEITPTSILWTIYNNARGIGHGPIVTRKEWQTYAKDLGGWFTYNGAYIDMRIKSIG